MIGTCPMFRSSPTAIPRHPPGHVTGLQVFWARYQELNDWEKVIKNIERGEQKIQRQADIMQAIRTKLERYKSPWQELKVCWY